VGPQTSDGCWTAEAGTALCSCESLSRTEVSDANGVLDFTWCRLGGRGRAEVAVSLLCFAAIEICRLPFSFTSPDLSGTCGPGPDSDTNVIDLGIWAGCLGAAPPCRASDYDCSCTVGVLDLAIFASGLGTNCGSG
jgi:hypothetical protein